MHAKNGAREFTNHYQLFVLILIIKTSIELRQYVSLLGKNKQSLRKKWEQNFKNEFNELISISN